jgi:hypothetical protein
MDGQLASLGNKKRASWRATCRNRLSQHICYLPFTQFCAVQSLTSRIGETLGIEVQPSDVRLKPEEDMPYRWQIDDPALEPLFQKHLSKHSVGAYMLLHKRVGQTFQAVRPDKDKVVDHYLKSKSESLNIPDREKAGRPRSHRTTTS